MRKIQISKLKIGRRNELVIFQIKVNKYVKTYTNLLIFNKIKMKNEKNKKELKL